jgi:hypothetical protein
MELHAMLFRDVDFGLGIFGKLNKGGSLELRQEQIEPGRWTVTFYDLNIRGRVWFFKTIGKQGSGERWGFQPTPSNLTLEDAAEIAKRAASESQAQSPY